MSGCSSSNPYCIMILGKIWYELLDYDSAVDMMREFKRKNYKTARMLW